MRRTGETIRTLSGHVVEVVVPETRQDVRWVARQKALGLMDWRESLGDYDKPNPYKRPYRSGMFPVKEFNGVKLISGDFLKDPECIFEVNGKQVTIPSGEIDDFFEGTLLVYKRWIKYNEI